MERKLKSLLITTGVIMGFAAAFLPLTSYAVPASPDCKTVNGTNGSKDSLECSLDISQESNKSDTIPVAVTIQPVLTLDVSVNEPSSSTDDMSFTISPNTVAEGAFSATVSSNKIYSLYVHAKDGQTDLLRSGDTAESVNKIPGNGNVVEGQTGWGIKLASDQNYQAIPATMSTPFHTSSTPVSTDTTNFKVGIAVGASLAAGTYSTTLVVTATNSAAN